MSGKSRTNVWEGSWVVSVVRKGYGRLLSLTTELGKWMPHRRAILEFRKSLKEAPLKVGGCVLLVAVGTNTLLLLAGGGRLNPMQIGFRILWVVLAAAGLMSRSDWDQVRRSSCVLQAWARWTKGG